MSRHRKVKVEYESPACCGYPSMYGMGGFGGGMGFGGGQGGYYGGGGAAWGIRWIYALLIVVVIVLTFGRKEFPFVPAQTNACDGTSTGIAGYGGLFGGYGYNNETIDRSVLFIIVVFLLILCGGCWWGGYSGGYGGGGCGSF